MVLLAATDRLRLNFRTYMFLLCGFYLTLVLVLHIKLNREKSFIVTQGGKDNKGQVIHMEVKVDKNSRNKYENLMDKNLKDLIRDKLQNQDHKNKGEFDSKFAAVKPEHADPSRTEKQSKEQQEKALGYADSCIGVKPEIADTFQEGTVENVFLYSAYWDSRQNDFDNKDSGIYIRIMAVIKLNHKPDLKCAFRIGNDYLTSGLSYYEMCENHMRPYGGYILSCKVPAKIEGPVCSVTVTTGSQPKAGDATLLVQNVAPRPDKKKFSICVPPIFGSVDKHKIVEFIELSQILGAEHITFYDFDAHKDLLQTLRYYDKKGITSVIPWKLPDKATRFNIWYNGQLIAIQDCLYRHMGKTDYVLFNDIDEFATPHSANNWTGLVKTLDSSKHCGFQFKMAFFDPRPETASADHLSDPKYKELLTATHIKRTSVLSRVRTKCMVKPHLVFEKGIHHISKPLFADLQVSQVDPKAGFLHHYRVCLGDFGMSCSSFEEDKTMMQYTETLYKRVQRSLEDLGESR